MYRDNYIKSLQSEIVEMVADHLTPVAIRYGYSDVPLQTTIKWRPLVLILGNYSSGKSTLINEFLGSDIQATGQAPTDDSFTIITYDETIPEEEGIRVTEERDGKVLLNDPEYPFEILKKHGQRFASHFRLKKVNSSFLKDVALIDTPGMLDSITERDRGYNYQEVIGDFAQLSDLILVLFDPHKAGTVREAHQSLRETLPSRTFEDRVMFVLNRIDECTSLIDLIRVYGTLCWNLSQITGRKDIPMIHLTYSPHVLTGSHSKTNSADTGYLHYLDNQREELKKAILNTPHRRLDHLATFVETHAERLAHFLEALISYRKHLSSYKLKNMGLGLISSILFTAVFLLVLMVSGLAGAMNFQMFAGIGGIMSFGVFLFWMTVLRKTFISRFHLKMMKHIDELTPLPNQTRKDCWESVRHLVLDYLKKTSGQFSSYEVHREYADVRRVYEYGSREIREALNELATLRDNDFPELDLNDMLSKEEGNTVETEQTNISNLKKVETHWF